MTKRRITIELDEAQAAILVELIDGILQGDGDSGPERMATGVRRAVSCWGTQNTDDFEYATVKIAPVYLQLLPHLGQFKDAGLLFAENLADFVLALRDARAALRQHGADVDAPSRRR